MKKVLILYHSVYGNTRSVAMALSRGLEAGNQYVDCVPIEGFDMEETINYDVIGIGGPTHFRGASKSMKSFLNKLKRLELGNLQGFIFETRGDFRLAGSAAKKIMSSLRKTKIKIIHSIITGIVLNKEGPLREKTQKEIEQIGLEISDNINNTIMFPDTDREPSTFKSKSYKSILNYLKWILIAGGPIFFFIRALYFVSTGGDCFGKINPYLSWFLLILGIVISGITGINAIISLILIEIGKRKRVITGRFSLKNLLLITGISSYLIHFIRVGFWIAFCVI